MGSSLLQVPASNMSCMPGDVDHLAARQSLDKIKSLKRQLLNKEKVCLD